ncbi:hypothetical protein [Vibrio chagasii]|uniref:hypothetical protein n=1 Tax=Vibrio chagasii TaxID=170679 RepID=UPI002284BCBB|nr:hypothetical protein [Vibrio chagasii]MCY9825875.1 hypothetical protein [Vibrio chagasii]
MKLTSITQRKNQVNPTTTGKIKKPEKLTSNKPNNALIRQQIVQMNLQERPKLIAEVADSHKMYSRLMMAGEVLRTVASELIKLRQLAELNQYSPEQANHIDVIKKKLVFWSQKRLFGDYVVDSSFAPIQGDNPFIEFTIPGLDLQRERFRDEVVSLYINNRLIPLAFERSEDREVLLEQFKMMFAYAHLQLRINAQQEFVIGIRDQQWRLWVGRSSFPGKVVGTLQDHRLRCRFKLAIQCWTTSAACWLMNRARINKSMPCLNGSINCIWHYRKC